MKIAIAGFGAEGKSNFNYYASQGGNEITIADERSEVADLPAGVPTILGEGAFGRLQGFDMVMRTAGLNPNKIQTDGRIWSATNEFFARCPAPIIGVTGSKGKGTTCSLIAGILRAAGHTVHLLGNIGVPALGVLETIQPEDIVVYELSSFQLWDAERSPHVAVILYMEPEHMDVHSSMEEYVRAKANIRLHQTMDDICFYHPDNQYVQQITEMPGDVSTDSFKHRDWRWRAFRYGVREARDASVATVYIERGMFCIQRPNEEKVSTVSVSDLKLLGEHNQLNACAAIDAALVYGVSDEAISQGLSSFQGLPHRLQFIREVGGIKYYDDSYASTPASSAAAMRAFEQPKVMILGGSSKGVSFDELAKTAADSNVRAVIAIGDEGAKIETAMRNKNLVVFNIGKVSMQEIITIATGQAKEGDVIVLSPACASFDMFKSYTDRGEKFTEAVNQLA